MYAPRDLFSDRETPPKAAYLKHMQNHMLLVIASILCNPFVKERETMEEFCWLGKETV